MESGRNWELIMDERFEEWAGSCTAAVVRRWGQALIDAGVTWETFDRDDASVVEDLISVGIPRIAARDVVNVVKQSREQALHKATRPMAVFWDIENIQIPRNMTASETVERIKSKLVRLGPLSDIRAYSDGGLHTIPEEKRRELQQSGVHILDTPHVGAKEVADKMIIVDAMEFAYKNIGGATLVFITGDSDFAYMLARLQQPQWRTVVIARGSMRSMLHMNASTTLRWDTDIIGTPSRGAQETSPTTPVGPNTLIPQPPRTISHNSQPSNDGEDGMPETESVVLLDDDDDDGADSLTDREKLADDREVLQTIVRQLALKSVPMPPLKADVGNALRQQNPLRFSTRELVREALAAAIEAGVLIESGEGATKRVALAEDAHTGLTLWLTDTPPWSALQLPENARQAAATERPFVLAVLKSLIPHGTRFAGAYVSTNDATRYLFLLFRRDFDAERFAKDHPYVQGGIFFNYRRHIGQVEAAEATPSGVATLSEPSLHENVEDGVRMAYEAVVHHCSKTQAPHLVKAQLHNDLIARGLRNRGLRELCVTQAVQRGLLCRKDIGFDIAYSPNSPVADLLPTSPPQSRLVAEPPVPREQLNTAKTALLNQLNYLESNDILLIVRSLLIKTTSEYSGGTLSSGLLSTAIADAVAERALVEVRVGQNWMIALPQHAEFAADPHQYLPIDEHLLEASFQAIVTHLRAALPTPFVPKQELSTVLRACLPAEMASSPAVRARIFHLGGNAVPPVFKTFRRDDLHMCVVCLPENLEAVRQTNPPPAASSGAGAPPSAPNESA